MAKRVEPLSSSVEHAERQRYAERYIIGVGVLLVLLILALTAFGYAYSTRCHPVR